MKKLILLSSVAACVVFTPTIAFAQTADTAPQAASTRADDFDAIIVTARRRAEDVSKVPIAITAFSGEALQARGITNTSDLAKLTPGLNIAGGGTKANPFVVLRGQSKAVTGTGSPGVITYFNDVPLPNYGSLIQTYDMANIQVLKGPQGTLFGRNSIGGAILTNSQAPTHEFGGYVSGDIASFDNQQLEGAINVPIVKDKIAIRLAAQVGHDGGNVKTFLYSPYTLNPAGLRFNANGSLNAAATAAAGFATPGQLRASTRNFDEFRTSSFRASVLIEPTDWFRNVTVFDYSMIRGTPGPVAQRFASFNNGPAAIYQAPPAFIPTALGLSSATPAATASFFDIYANGVIPALAQCATNQLQCNFNVAAAQLNASNGQRISYATQDPWLARTIVKGVTNTTSITVGDHTLKNIFGYRVVDSFNNTSLSGLPLPVINTMSNVNLQQTTDEIQLAGTFFDNKLRYTLGGFFYNEKPNGPGGFQALEVNALFGLSHSLSTTYLHNTSKAVYGQIDYSLDALVEGLTVTAGARQTWDTQSACTTGQSLNPLGASMVVVSSNDLSAIPSEDACRANAAGIGAQSFPDAHFKKLTYTLGVNWQITPRLMIYATTRRGYRAGGYNTPLFDPYLASAQVYRPEQLTDYEIGTKFRWNVGRVRGSVELAAFTGKDKDNQLPINVSNLNAGTCIPEAVGTGGRTTPTCATAGSAVPNGVPVALGTQTLTDNAGEITLRGFEFAGNISPIEGLTFGGSVGYVETVVDKLSLNPVVLNLLTRAGRFAPTTIVIQGQPEWTWNANMTAEYPDKILGGDLSLVLDYRHSDSYQQVEVRIPANNQMDARVRLADIGGTGITASAYVKNLTNETTYAGGSSTSPSGVGVSSYLLGQSRTVGLQLLYKFGS
ncbi:hypothetical protein BH10PSE13_BH10PSE13_09530 [soil metagenome]